ncbi:MAG: DUF1467 family protein [Devosiaceae bacterium]|nr:DUF1467 family protein [Devosiaceae bacterium]
MPLASLFAVYVVVWWTCLFLVLPFGVKNQSDIGEVTPGTEPGSPILSKLRERFFATTIVSAIVMALLMWAISSPVLREYWY